MSSLVEMVQRTDDYKQAIKEGGIPNTELLELLYADDTMIISKKNEQHGEDPAPLGAVCPALWAYL